MGIPSSNSESERIEREERRRDLMEARGNNLVKRAKNPPSFAEINEKVSEQELVAAIHEELTLKRMDNDYDNFLDAKEKNDKSQIGHFIDLFWRNQQRFSLPIPNLYLWDYQRVLRSNPDFAEEYSKVNSSELHQKRRKFWNEYNDLCITMNAQAQQYD